MLLFGDAGNPSNGFYERMGQNASSQPTVIFTVAMAGVTYALSPLTGRHPA